MFFFKAAFDFFKKLDDLTYLADEAYFFKDEYGMIFTEDIEEADCCLNCAEVHDKKLNSEQKLWCSKFSRWVKPINHCKNWK